MKTLLFLLLFAVTANAQEITRDDIRKTIEHMQQLSRAQAGELKSTQDQLNIAVKQIETTKTEAKSLQAESNRNVKLRLEAVANAERFKTESEKNADTARKNAKERDVFIYIIAAWFALSVIAKTGPYIGNVFPAYAIAFQIGIMLAAGALAYVTCRFVITFLAKFIPFAQ